MAISQWRTNPPNGRPRLPTAYDVFDRNQWLESLQAKIHNGLNPPPSPPATTDDDDIQGWLEDTNAEAGPSSKGFREESVFDVVHHDEDEAPFANGYAEETLEEGHGQPGEHLQGHLQADPVFDDYLIANDDGIPDAAGNLADQMMMRQDGGFEAQWHDAELVPSEGDGDVEGGRVDFEEEEVLEDDEEEEEIEGEDEEEEEDLEEEEDYEEDGEDEEEGGALGVEGGHMIEHIAISDQEDDHGDQRDASPGAPLFDLQENTGQPIVPVDEGQEDDGEDGDEDEDAEKDYERQEEEDEDEDEEVEYEAQDLGVEGLDVVEYIANSGDEDEPSDGNDPLHDGPLFNQDQVVPQETAPIYPALPSTAQIYPELPIPSFATSSFLAPSPPRPQEDVLGSDAFVVDNIDPALLLEIAQEVTGHQTVSEEAEQSAPEPFPTAQDSPYQQIGNELFETDQDTFYRQEQPEDDGPEVEYALARAADFEANMEEDALYDSEVAVPEAHDMPTPASEHDELDGEYDEDDDDDDLALDPTQTLVRGPGTPTSLPKDSPEVIDISSDTESDVSGGESESSQGEDDQDESDEGDENNGSDGSDEGDESEQTRDSEDLEERPSQRLEVLGGNVEDILSGTSPANAEKVLAQTTIPSTAADETMQSNPFDHVEALSKSNDIDQVEPEAQDKASDLDLEPAADVLGEERGETRSQEKPLEVPTFAEHSPRREMDAESYDQDMIEHSQPPPILQVEAPSSSYHAVNVDVPSPGEESTRLAPFYSVEDEAPRTDVQAMEAGSMLDVPLAIDVQPSTAENLSVQDIEMSHAGVAEFSMSSDMPANADLSQQPLEHPTAEPPAEHVTEVVVETTEDLEGPIQAIPEPVVGVEKSSADMATAVALENDTLADEAVTSPPVESAIAIQDPLAMPDLSYEIADSGSLDADARMFAHDEPVAGILTAVSAVSEAEADLEELPIREELPNPYLPAPDTDAVALISPHDLVPELPSTASLFVEAPDVPAATITVTGNMTRPDSPVLFSYPHDVPPDAQMSLPDVPLATEDVPDPLIEPLVDAPADPRQVADLETTEVQEEVEEVVLPDPNLPPPDMMMDLPRLLPGEIVAKVSPSPSLIVEPPDNPPDPVSAVVPPFQEESNLPLPDPSLAPPDTDAISPLQPQLFLPESTSSASVIVEPRDHTPVLVESLPPSREGSPALELDTTSPIGVRIPSPIADEQSPDETLGKEAFPTAPQDVSPIPPSSPVQSSTVRPPHSGSDFIRFESSAPASEAGSSRDEPETPLEGTLQLRLMHHHGVGQTNVPQAPHGRTRSQAVATATPVVTRSHCTYRKMRISDEDLSAVLLVPQCSLGEPEKLKEERSEDAGEPTEEEELEAKMKPITEQRPLVHPRLAHKIHRIVGHTIYNEGTCYLLYACDDALDPENHDDDTPRKPIARHTKRKSEHMLLADELDEARMTPSRSPALGRKRRMLTPAHSGTPGPSSVGESPVRGTRSRAKQLERSRSMATSDRSQTPTSKLASTSPSNLMSSLPLQQTSSAGDMGDDDRDATPTENIDVAAPKVEDEPARTGKRKSRKSADALPITPTVTSIALPSESQEPPLTRRKTRQSVKAESSQSAEPEQSSQIVEESLTTPAKALRGHTTATSQRITRRSAKKEKEEAAYRPDEEETHRDETPDAVTAKLEDEGIPLVTSTRKRKHRLSTAVVDTSSQESARSIVNATPTGRVTRGKRRAVGTPSNPDRPTPADAGEVGVLLTEESETDVENAGKSAQDAKQGKKWWPFA